MAEKIKKEIEQIKSGKVDKDLSRVFLGKIGYTPEKALERFDKLANQANLTMSERKRVYSAATSRLNKVLNSVEKATDAEIAKRAKEINTTPSMAKRMKAARGDMKSRFAYWKDVIASGPEEGHEGKYEKIPEVEKVKDDMLDMGEYGYRKSVRKKAKGGKVYHPRSGSRKVKD